MPPCQVYAPQTRNIADSAPLPAIVPGILMLILFIKWRSARRGKREERSRGKKKTKSIFIWTTRLLLLFFCIIAISKIFICPSFSAHIYIHAHAWIANLQCSRKWDLNIFRLTVPIICIPLTHSEQRHLSRNTADKRETINPRKITGTESLSCILPEMRQRSYYVHPSGLASESKQCSWMDVVLLKKGTLYWTETLASWQTLLQIWGSSGWFLKTFLSIQ